MAKSDGLTLPATASTRPGASTAHPVEPWSPSAVEAVDLQAVQPVASPASRPTAGYASGTTPSLSMRHLATPLLVRGGLDLPEPGSLLRVAPRGEEPYATVQPTAPSTVRGRRAQAGFGQAAVRVDGLDDGRAFEAARASFAPRVVFHQPVGYGGFVSNRRNADAVIHKSVRVMQPAEDDPETAATEPPLVFDASLESTNLCKVIQVGPIEYDLILRNDIDTAGYTQWFYFAVGNTHPANSSEGSVCGYCGVKKVKRDRVRHTADASWLGSYRPSQGISQLALSEAAERRAEAAVVHSGAAQLGASLTPERKGEHLIKIADDDEIREGAVVTRADEEAAAPTGEPWESQTEPGPTPSHPASEVSHGARGISSSQSKVVSHVGDAAPRAADSGAARNPELEPIGTAFVTSDEGAADLSSEEEDSGNSDDDGDSDPGDVDRSLEVEITRRRSFSLAVSEQRSVESPSAPAGQRDDEFVCPRVHEFRFNIVNMKKPGSLFNEGMRPVMYSTFLARTQGAGWFRAGRNVAYATNKFEQMGRKRRRHCYRTLMFTLPFSQPGDTCLVSMSYPYTVTDHVQHLESLFQRKCAKACLRRSTLCRTVWGKECDLITISDRRCTEEEWKSRPVVVLSARVHPGEVGASWMMRGCLDFLVSELPRAVLLRKSFVFKLVPMLNPDGVAVGNNRCSLMGVDLNRCWEDPDEREHPTIHATKALLSMYRERVALYVDLHGHSRAQNVFMYGVGENMMRTAASSFPKVVAQNALAQGIFEYANCSFDVHKSREGTARVVVARELRIPQSYTMEASFAGDMVSRTHFGVPHFHRMGQALCDAIVAYKELPIAARTLPVGYISGEMPPTAVLAQANGGGKRRTKHRIRHRGSADSPSERSGSTHRRARPAPPGAPSNILTGPITDDCTADSREAPRSLPTAHQVETRHGVAAVSAPRRAAVPLRSVTIAHTPVADIEPHRRESKQLRDSSNAAHLGVGEDSGTYAAAAAATPVRTDDTTIGDAAGPRSRRPSTSNITAGAVGLEIWSLKPAGGVSAPKQRVAGSRSRGSTAQRSRDPTPGASQGRGDADRGSCRSPIAVQGPSDANRRLYEFAPLNESMAAVPSEQPREGRGESRFLVGHGGSSSITTPVPPRELKSLNSTLNRHLGSKESTSAESASTDDLLGEPGRPRVDSDVEHPTHAATEGDRERTTPAEATLSLETSFSTHPVEGDAFQDAQESNAGGMSATRVDERGRSLSGKPEQVFNIAGSSPERPPVASVSPPMAPHWPASQSRTGGEVSTPRHATLRGRDPAALKGNPPGTASGGIVEAASTEVLPESGLVVGRASGPRAAGRARPGQRTVGRATASHVASTRGLRDGNRSSRVMPRIVVQNGPARVSFTTKHRALRGNRTVRGSWSTMPSETRETKVQEARVRAILMAEVQAQLARPVEHWEETRDEATPAAHYGGGNHRAPDNSSDGMPVAVGDGVDASADGAEFAGVPTAIVPPSMQALYSAMHRTRADASHGSSKDREEAARWSAARAKAAADGGEHSKGSAAALPRHEDRAAMAGEAPAGVRWGPPPDAPMFDQNSGFASLLGGKGSIPFALAEPEVASRNEFSGLPALFDGSNVGGEGMSRRPDRHRLLPDVHARSGGHSRGADLPRTRLPPRSPVARTPSRSSSSTPRRKQRSRRLLSG